MASRDILIDGFGRVDSVVHSILRDVTEEQLSFRADPDAHTIEGYNDIRYGVLAAQKAGLTAADNLSSFGLEKFRGFLAERKKVKGI